MREAVRHRTIPTMPGALSRARCAALDAPHCTGAPAAGRSLVRVRPDAHAPLVRCPRRRATSCTRAKTSAGGSARSQSRRARVRPGAGRPEPPDVRAESAVRRGLGSFGSGGHWPECAFTDEQWAWTEPLLPDRTPKRGAAGVASRGDCRDRLQVPDRLAVGSPAAEVRPLAGRLQPAADMGLWRHLGDVGRKGASAALRTGPLTEGTDDACGATQNFCYPVSGMSA